MGARSEGRGLREGREGSRDRDRDRATQPERAEGRAVHWKETRGDEGTDNRRERKKGKNNDVGQSKNNKNKQEKGDTQSQVCERKGKENELGTDKKVQRPTRAAVSRTTIRTIATDTAVPTRRT